MHPSDLIPRFLKPVACVLGLHSWEPEPRTVSPIKLTGPDLLFWTFGEQEGTGHCEACPQTTTYVRSGLVGVGGWSERWKRKDK